MLSFLLYLALKCIMFGTFFSMCFCLTFYVLCKRRKREKKVVCVVCKLSFYLFVFHFSIEICRKKQHTNTFLVWFVFQDQIIDSLCRFRSFYFFYFFYFGEFRCEWARLNSYVLNNIIKRIYLPQFLYGCL